MVHKSSGSGAGVSETPIKTVGNGLRSAPVASVRDKASATTLRSEGLWKGIGPHLLAAGRHAISCAMETMGPPPLRLAKFWSAPHAVSEYDERGFYGGPHFESD